MDNIKNLNSNFVINPITGRVVKAGSRLYNSLVRDGILNRTVEKQIERKKTRGNQVVAKAENPTQAYRLKSQLEKERPLGNDKVYTICNDKKSVAIRHKKAPVLKPDNIIPYMSEASLRVNKKLLKDKQFMDKLNNIPENEITSDLRSHIENLLLQELIYRGDAPKSNKIVEKNFSSINNKDNNAKNTSKTKFKLAQKYDSKPTDISARGRTRGRCYTTTDTETSCFEQTDRFESEDENEGYTSFDD